MKLRAALLGAAAAASLTLVATPASAATTHYDTPTSCYDVGSGQTACYTTAGHYNTTTTASGNYVYAGQGHSTYTITDASGAVIYTTDYEYKYNVLTQDGVTQVSRTLYHSEYQSGGQTCVADDNYLFANGTVRHNDLVVTCA